MLPAAATSDAPGTRARTCRVVRDSPGALRHWVSSHGISFHLSARHLAAVPPFGKVVPVNKISLTAPGDNGDAFSGSRSEWAKRDDDLESSVSPATPKSHQRSISVPTSTQLHALPS